MDFRQFQLAFTAVKIGLPAAMANGNSSVDRLSNALRIPADRLVRLLRGLVWSGILTIDNDSIFSLTESGRALCDPGQAQGLLFQGELFYRAWGELSEFMLNGTTPFDRAHGVSIFELLKRDPRLAEVYGAPMAQRSSEYSATVAKHPALQNAGHIVDVAGGHGRLLTNLLKALPKSTGVIFDLSIMQPGAQRIIDGEGLSDRCHFESGDMFAAVPTGADVYILKWVLHDWNDEKAPQILQSCHRSMRDDATLLVIERPMPESLADAARSGLVQADLNMLCQCGGAERALSAYQELGKQAGLKFVSCDRVDEFYGFHTIAFRRSD